MSKLTSFSDFVLTRSEMKGVKGGCKVWSQDSSGNRNYGKGGVSKSDASAQAKQNNSRNDGYTYGYCCSSCP